MTPVGINREDYDMYYGSRAFFGCTAGPDGRTWWSARIPALQRASDGTPVAGCRRLIQMAVRPPSAAMTAPVM